MSNMPRCKTCKWWDQIRESDTYGYCDWLQNAETSDWNASPTGNEALIYVEDQHVTTGMMTGPDFGCVQHEPKDEQP